MAKIHFRVELPDELLGEFLQVIRDFDTKHDPRHEDIVRIESLAESDWPVEKMEKVFKALTPGFKYFAVREYGKDKR